MFNKLCDICDVTGLTCGIRVYKHANKKVPATMGIVIMNGKKVICEYKMGEPDDPRIDELAGHVLDELEERGFISTSNS